MDSKGIKFKNSHAFLFLCPCYDGIVEFFNRKKVNCMKRILVLTSAVLLLSGCSIPYLDKLKGDHSGQQQHDDATANSDDTQNGQQSDSGQGTAAKMSQPASRWMEINECN